jgi:riboflavin biosynthesis pyrimidine reductase
MTDLDPLQDLYDAATGDALPLPEALARVYGALRLPRCPERQYVVGNFVATLDGVVSLGIPGQAGGGEISGFDAHDRMVMGLLRAVASAVVIGAGTLRAASVAHLWTADYISPPLADAFLALRSALGLTKPPLNVVVTGSGEIDLDRRLFCSGEVASLLVTTDAGACRLHVRDLPPWVQVAVGAETAPIPARAVLAAVQRMRPGGIVLLEAGPRLMGQFFAERLLDELFLTVAPQIAGRDETATRPGFVAGQDFAPEHPIWGTLVGLKRGGSHLFTRYAFARG